MTVPMTTRARTTTTEFPLCGSRIVEQGLTRGPRVLPQDPRHGRLHVDPSRAQRLVEQLADWARVWACYW